MGESLGLPCAEFVLNELLYGRQSFGVKFRKGSHGSVPGFALLVDILGFIQTAAVRDRLEGIVLEPGLVKCVRTGEVVDPDIEGLGLILSNLRRLLDFVCGSYFNRSVTLFSSDTLFELVDSVRNFVGRNYVLPGRCSFKHFYVSINSGIIFVLVLSSVK